MPLPRQRESWRNRIPRRLACAWGWWEAGARASPTPCSFDTSAGMMDKGFDMDGLKVFVDATSIMYLNGCRVDYIETLEGAGFKVENPNVKSTCGCGSSFNV